MHFIEWKINLNVLSFLNYETKVRTLNAFSVVPSIISDISKTYCSSVYDIAQISMKINFLRFIYIGVIYSTVTGKNASYSATVVLALAPY